MKKLKKAVKKLLQRYKQYQLVKPFDVVMRKRTLIVPYEELLDRPYGLSDHKGGPVWKNWSATNNLRHQRFAFEDDRPSPCQSKPIKETRPLFWCGAVVSHFGHQVADFTSRIPAYKVFEKAHPNLSPLYCFAVKKDSGIHSVKDTPSFFKQIMSWYEITEDQIYIIDQPVLAKTLFATPQAEVLSLNGSPIPINEPYISFLNRHVERKLGSVYKNGKTYYISRSQIKGGELAGEAYLDSFFKLNGISVVHPEKLTLVEQIQLYREAKNLIFLEGSALHGLQFLGETTTNIFIINRRSGYRVMQEAFDRRFPVVNYFDITQLIHGLTPAGDPARYDGISLLNRDKFQAFCLQLEFDFTLWDEEAFVRCETAQLKNWISRKKACPDTGFEASIALIKEKLIDLGLDYKQVM